MHAARIGALGLMHGEESADLAHDAVEGAGLEAARRNGVAMHGIAGPHDRAPLLLHRAHQGRQALARLLRAEAGDQGQATGLVGGVENVDQAQQIVGLQRGAAFEAQRVLHAPAIFNMGVIELAGAVADPDHVA